MKEMHHAIVERWIRGEVTEVIPSMSEQTMRLAMIVTAHPKAALLEKQGRKHNKIFSINVNIEISHLQTSVLSVWTE